jgi:outer membrane protein
LTYQAYNAGAVTFLEVDDANLAALQSRMMLSELNIRRLNNLAVMDSLGK